MTYNPVNEIYTILKEIADAEMSEKVSAPEFYQHNDEAKPSMYLNYDFEDLDDMDFSSLDFPGWTFIETERYEVGKYRAIWHKD